MNRTLSSLPAHAGGSRGAAAADPRTASLKARLLTVVLAVAAVVLALKLTGALDYLTFPALAENREWLVGRVDALGYAAPLLFILVYALSTALSLPTGLLLSTVGGFLF